MKNICIEVHNLTKSFGNRIAVDNLSFEVQKGTVFGLLGHNGAGKSTTIDMILGLKKGDKGKALVFGKDVKKNKAECFEKIGVQLQSSSYQGAIKVYEACIERASLYKNPRDYKELLEDFGLTPLKNSFISKLSGGEKQKLSIALTLIGNPEVIFLDELTTGLDVASRREVWKTLTKLKDKGLTIFLTTHYMEEAERLCDELMIIKKGKKVCRGSVEEIINNSPYDNLEDAYLWYMEEEKNEEIL